MFTGSRFGRPVLCEQIGGLSAYAYPVSINATSYVPLELSGRMRAHARVMLDGGVFAGVPSTTVRGFSTLATSLQTNSCLAIAATQVHRHLK